MGKPLFKSAKQIAVDAQALKLAVQRGDRVSNDKSTVRYEDDDSAYINTVLPDVVVTPKYKDYDDYNKTIAARDRRALEQQQHEMNNYVRAGMNKAGDVVAGAMMMMPPVAAADPIAAGVGYLGKSLAPTVAKTAAAVKRFFDPASIKYALSPLKPGYTKKYIEFVDDYVNPNGKLRTEYKPESMRQAALHNDYAAETSADSKTITAPRSLRQGSIMHELGHAKSKNHMIEWNPNADYYTLRDADNGITSIDMNNPDISASTFTKENYPALTARREYFDPEIPNPEKPNSNLAWYSSPEEIFSEYLNYRVTGKSKAAALRALDKRFNGTGEMISPLDDRRILPDEFKRVINTHQKVSGLDEHFINQTRKKFGYMKPGSLPDWAESSKNPLNYIKLNAGNYGLAYALKRDAVIGASTAAGLGVLKAADVAAKKLAKYEVDKEIEESKHNTE